MSWVESSDLHMLNQGMHTSFLQSKQRLQKHHDVRYLAVTSPKRIVLQRKQAVLGARKSVF